MTARELRFRVETAEIVYTHDVERERREWELIARDAVDYAESVEEDLCRLADLVAERRGERGG